MNFLKAIFVNNFSIKLISLILALLTWAYIGGQLYRKSLSTDEETPSIIKVSGENLTVKRLPISVNIEGEPAYGYRVAFDRIVISPSYSVVAGPQEIIKEHTHITTEPVNVAGENSLLKKRVRLNPIPGCKIGHDGDVRVTVPISRFRRR
ncbi:MAG: YbbR-like domain-containing protein [Candidatus Omnitrophota bacterium]